jgi:hypothetical protein
VLGQLDSKAARRTLDRSLQLAVVERRDGVGVLVDEVVMPPGRIGDLET